MTVNYLQGINPNKKSGFYIKHIKTKHSWHLIDPSPWPLLTALGAFTITLSLVLFMHNYYTKINMYLF